MRHFEFRCPVVVLHVMLALVCSASPSAADERPSNLLVVADDMGWTDLGCIGSEIDTRSHRPKTETIESFRMRRVSGQPSMQLAVLRNAKMPIAPNRGRAVGLSGGTYVEKMKLVDQWIGELMAEIDDLGIADNTLVIVMGDNGHFTKYSPQSGYTPMIFRGGKGSTSEGGVRVDAFVRWPGMIEADSVVGDIVHVSDLFTTIARLGSATDKIPADRIIDGVDQTSLLLNGETHGRRDYVFIYNINKLEAVVKEQYKLAIPGGNIDNAILADFYDLFRDPQEKYPVSTEIGAWGGAKFVRMIQRHLRRKAKYPDEGPATGMPYEGIDNLRPESKAAVKEFLFMMKTPER